MSMRIKREWCPFCSALFDLCTLESHSDFHDHVRACELANQRQLNRPKTLEELV